MVEFDSYDSVPTVKPMRIAAIDLGSNSFHMLVADLDQPNSFSTILRERMAIQIGKDALASGKLNADTMERGLRCLKEFRQIAFARGVERIVAVATSAIREAQDGDVFIHRVRTETGIVVRTISGREEARLIHLAVKQNVALGDKKALLIDIGGGSVELTVADSSKIYYTTSLKLGFLRVKKMLVSHDPMSKREEGLVADFLKNALARSLAAVKRYEPELVIATSGTATSLLRIIQQQAGDGWASAVIDADQVHSILEDTAHLNSLERARKLNLDVNRSECYPLALMCLQSVLLGVDAWEFQVCPTGLREGVVYDFVARNKRFASPGNAAGDLRRKAVLEMAARYGYPEAHSHKVACLARQIFDQTSHLHGMGENEAAVLEYAALLHDIGYHIGYNKHHKHGYYLIMNGELAGFAHEERVVLANLVRYHRKAKPSRAHPTYAILPRRVRLKIKRLSAILRIADGLDRSHFSLCDEIQCRHGSDERVQFQLMAAVAGMDIALDLYSAKRHARYFEKVFGVEASFTAKSLPAAPVEPAPALPRNHPGSQKLQHPSVRCRESRRSSRKSANP
jgi:exopolyphosphatase/guanosine-5'-triphosphate,3'-diphosphate pyrophosphatase